MEDMQADDMPTGGDDSNPSPADRRDLQVPPKAREILSVDEAAALDIAEVEPAILALRRQIKTDPEAEDPATGRRWEVLGILQWRFEQLEASLWSLEMASMLRPLSTRGQMVLAASSYKAGHVETARAIYQHLAAAILLEHLESDLLDDLAAGLGRVGDCDLALTVCREFARRNPGNAGPLLGIVHFLRRMRRPAATVLPYLERAFDLDPSDTECRISLAWILHSCGRSEDGACLLDEISLADLECVRSLTLMRRVYEAVQDEHCATVCKYRLEALAARKWRERP